MLDKKKIWAVFLFEFKMGHKAAETTCIINNTFGPGIAHKHAVQWWLNKSEEIKESLEDEEHSGRWSEVDKRTITEADPLTTAQEVAQELNIDHLMVIWHLKQTGKVKCLINGCLMSWQKIKKPLFWSVIFS